LPRTCGAVCFCFILSIYFPVQRQFGFHSCQSWFLASWWSVILK
jgi:hypothetical protein